MEVFEKKQATKLMWLCAFIYFISYITRINYGAVIAEMVTSTGLAKSALSLALTGSFITYGAGQLISGYFGDKFQPKLLIALGLITSICMNLLIPICNNHVQMTVVWCFNGFAQAFMWPPLVKLLASTLTKTDYDRACVVVAWGSSFGTILVYLASPVIIALSGWRTVFFTCALFGVAGLMLWLKCCPKIEMDTTALKHKEITQTPKKAFITPLLFGIMIAIILQGIIKDGVTTWMPSYIAETFKLSNEISILTGIVLPVFTILSYRFTQFLYKTKLRNPVICSTVMFTTATVSALLLYMLSDKNPIISVAFSALLTGCVHGVNLMFISIVPPLIAEKGKVSVVSGLLNACSYIGSALATYLIPIATEFTGRWSTTLFLWLLTAASGTLICIICISPWNKRTKSETISTNC